MHPPKNISSKEGLGLGTTKEMRYINRGLAIGTETWNELENPWSESDTIIALPGYKWVTKWEVGKPYIITKFFDDNNVLIGVYCDISRPVEASEEGFRFDDLYLDVWQIPGTRPVILDQDELEEAVEAGHISKEEAGKTWQIAHKVVNCIENDPDFLDF